MQEYSTRGGKFTTFLAADAVGQICGFIEASIRTNAEGCTTTPVGYIEGIFVQPASRRWGVGRLLVSAAEGWVRSRGCSEFASDCHAHNEASIEFHRRLGFTVSKQMVHFHRRVIL
jgi:aminoglycoside 6'-N-acetyltransferase I